MDIWKPSDIRKIIVQIFGICLSVGGIYLLTTSSKIESTTVIKFNFKEVGTELHTGQVGLVLIFFGFLLVLIPSISSKKKEINTNDTPLKIFLHKAATILISVIVVVVLLALMSYLKVNDGIITMTSIFILMLLLIGVVAVIFSGNE